MLFFATSTLAHGAEVVGVKYDPARNAVALTHHGVVTSECKLQGQLKNVRPVLNWNKSIVLLTNIDYVTSEELRACESGSVQPSHIPDQVGFVVDVNPKAKMYLALDVIAASPPSYIALVAKLGSRKPVASFPGMYSAKKSMEKMQEEGLGYDENSPGRISPDGRYVSVDGSMNCDKGSFPGVWDLTTKKLVEGNPDCSSLFDGKSP